MRTLFLVYLLIFPLVAFADEQPTQSPKQLLDGRWDSIKFTPPGENESSSVWAESFEFNGDRIVSDIYKLTELPSHSLFVKFGGRSSTFTLAKGVFADQQQITITDAYGRKVRGTLYVDTFHLLLDLEMPTKADPHAKHSVLAVKAPEPNARNLQLEDLRKLQGTWHVVGDDTQLSRFVFDGVKVTVVIPTSYGLSLKGIPIVLDPSKNPKWLDEIGDQKRVSRRAIYELNGDKLRWCVAGDEQDRPSEFKMIRNDKLDQVYFELIRLKKISVPQRHISPK